LPNSSIVRGHSERWHHNGTVCTDGSSSVSCPLSWRRRLSDAKARRERLGIAAVGAGNKGFADIQCCQSEQIVAVCDVDQNMAAAALKANPRARFYLDWRKMFDREARNFDAVTVSTPDHLHAVIASHAIKQGKHVYCQKPLVQNLHEATYLRDLAKQSRVVTQMGNQGSANDSFRRAVELIHAGLIGSITRVYIWSDRPIWPQGIRRPQTADPLPPNFNWDAWLGPAPERPFHRGTYHPFNWRAWYDFGTGALGDMGCHLLNLPFRAASLGWPATVEPLNETDANPETYPSRSTMKFSFPPRQNLPATELFWSDGLKRGHGAEALPQSFTNAVRDLLGNSGGSGCLLVGERGLALAPGDYGERLFLRVNGEKEFTEASSHALATSVPQSIPRIRGRGYADLKHHLEWITACKGGSNTYSNFESITALTEIVLLGCIALRLDTPVHCDPAASKIIGPPAALALAHREYRHGWELA
jgi:hypothetical protein